MPFGVHLFCEPQIEQYIRYYTKEKYSFLHKDASGGVLKKCVNKISYYFMQLLLQIELILLILFHLHIQFLQIIQFLKLVIFWETWLTILLIQVKGIFIVPSFFVIDFYAAEMNAILQAFNGENINTHLNRCWDILCGKYNSAQLLSLSFIHFCCCPVIHAVARSLTAVRID